MNTLERARALRDVLDLRASMLATLEQGDTIIMPGGVKARAVPLERLRAWSGKLDDVAAELMPK